ncbi:sensor histidine kinase, partial [Robiginitalea sp.]|uniref:sensor histidine kinase n=1 Tax=Robiginitalea sp. TaxID=1902411 RepID=UPI003C712E82
LEQYAKNLEKDVAQRTEEVESTLQKLMESNLSLQTQIETTQKAEERALANQELFAAIARNFPKGVIMVFNTSRHYVHLEGEELDRMELRNWMFLGKPILNTPGFSAEELKGLDKKVRQTLRGQHLSFEIHIKENTYAVNSMPLYVGESPGWALLVLTNVTEQKKSEEDLLRALRIEQELNDLKSRFISMASHEFRTPLSAIHSSAILIGKQNTPGMEDKRMRYLRQIKNNVRNLVVILDDFLSLSKLEEGNIEAQPDTFDALDLIRSVLEELESNLKVGQHFAETFEMSALNVHQDPKLLRQILVNLLSNAIKYAPEKTGISIAIEKSKTAFSITIKDRGMGIPEEEQEQLFNRFFRARNAINIPGTGLGLHLVKLYTELMGGTITFKSFLNRGSTFTLRLPLVFNAK